MDGIIIGVVLVITLLVAFLIEKKPWRGYKSFADWEAQMVKKLKGSGDWIRKQPQNLKELVLKLVLALWAKRPPLKPLYIVLATFIGFIILYLFVILCLEIYWIEWKTIATDDSKTRNYAIAFIGLVSGFGALFGVYLAIERTDESKNQTKESKRQSKAAEREAETAEQGLITDRLNKAVEGLGKRENGKPIIEVRIGALYALERIAQDSIRDHISIMEILCAYIRQNSPRTDETDNADKLDPLREDIKAALTIIERRANWSMGQERLIMENTHGYRLSLYNCNLRKVFFNKAELSRANFYMANLKGTWLNYANLSGARLDDAVLTGTWFNHAKTEGAFLYKGDISNCRKFTQAQLDVMYCGVKVKIPDNLKRPEHWLNYELPWEEFYNLYREWLKKTHPDLAKNINKYD